MNTTRCLVCFLAVIAALAMVGCTSDAADDGGENDFCSMPAPLHGQFDASAPGYIVMFESGVDPTEEVARLSAEYPIEVASVYEQIGGFHGLMSEETRERLRCEPTIASVGYNSVGDLGARVAPSGSRNGLTYGTCRIIT